MNQQHELIPRTTGEFLKQRRLARKLSLAEVSLAVSLDEQLLDKIEQEQTLNIAPVYRNGYIRVYARFLQIPDDEIKALIPSTENQQPEIRNIFSAPPRRHTMDKWLRSTSYVLASLLIGTLAWQFTYEAVRLSQNGSQFDKVEENLSRFESAVNPDQAKKVKGTVNASIAPLGVLHDAGSDGLDTAEQAWAAVSRPALPDGESRLHLSVSADSWVEITDANEQQLEMDLLRGGSEKGYHGTPPFRILLGRASAVRLSVDGEPVNLSGYSSDDVAQLTWPQYEQAENNGQNNN